MPAMPVLLGQEERLTLENPSELVRNQFGEDSGSTTKKNLASNKVEVKTDT